MKRANYGNKLEQWRAMQESGCHIATSPTSRRLNVATSQRRDVSSRSAPHHLKYKWLRNREVRRRTNEGTEFKSRVTQTLKECPGFVLFLIFVGY